MLCRHIYNKGIYYNVTRVEVEHRSQKTPTTGLPFFHCSHSMRLTSNKSQHKNIRAIELVPLSAEMYGDKNTAHLWRLSSKLEGGRCG